MDFEHAAARLARDQSQLRRQKNKRGGELSAKAKREAAYRKRQQEKLAAERQRQKREQEYREQYFRQCERALGVRQLTADGGSLQLKAISIHGEGDKIALPPSVLELLTQQQEQHDGTSEGGSPWTFRIGILNPDYTFPASPVLLTLPVPEEDSEHIMVDDNSDDEDGPSIKCQAYLDELHHKYLVYTHGTVVEFTQEEGHVGLPEPIAAALLDPRQRRKDSPSANPVPCTRTVDPASGEAMVVEEDESEKTPGHLAWGAFDVPDAPIEISMVQLPKGKACRLVPTQDAIQNGFYNLNDIKLVLEQSLIRTRATLSVGDTVHTWHRGKKFDLTVTEVTPSTYQSVTCINTDIEVEFGEPQEAGFSGGKSISGMESSTTPVSDSGRLLGSTSPTTTATLPPMTPQTARLLPEPPTDQYEGVVTVQIRSNTGSGQRRFEIDKATLSDLFAFATSILQDAASPFQLVTRFPRRVFTLEGITKSRSLREMGIAAGQELFMVEKI
jgi:hypothetical protein